MPKSGDKSKYYAGAPRDRRSGEVALEMQQSGEVALDAHVLNSWSTLGNVLQKPGSDFWNDLTPISHYEDAVRQGGQYTDEQTDEILARSDQARIVRYNALVNRYNQGLDNMKSTRDVNEARSLYDEAMELIRGN